MMKKEVNEAFIQKPEDNLYLDQNNFAIVGKKGSGKTSLAWSFAENISKKSKRTIYVLNHPKPELLKKLPFEVHNINSVNKLNAITDGVVIIDEAHRVFDVLNKRVNEQLKYILSTSRQNNTDFIFVCHNSYFINRSLFSFVDVRIIKEVNEQHWALERPHMAKLYQDVSVFGANNFFIDSDYIKGQQVFTKPNWYTDELSTAYRSESKRGDFFKDV